MASDDAVRERVRRRILRMCGAGMPLPELQLEVAAALRQAIPCDAWCLGTMDPATLMLTGSVGEGYVMKGSGRFLQIEYGEPDVNKYADLARREPPVGRLLAATGDAPETSAYWRDICQPSGLYDELRAALVVDHTCWGSLALARGADSGVFTERDAGYLAGLSAPIAVALRAALILGDPVVHDLSTGPGLVLLAEDGSHPVAVSPAGKRRLAELRELESEWMGPLPNVVYSVLARLREVEADGAAPPDLLPRARVRLRDGSWLSVQATRLTTETGGVQTAVILEPAAPAEMAALIAGAYRLTGREAEVAARVLQGMSTKDIAAALFISPATVQQHLKSVFDKVGVRSRRELVGRIFHQQYQPRIKAGRGVGPDGWFAD